MKKTSLAVLVALAAVAGVAHADDNQIREIRDPGQIAAIEQHAQELREHPEAAPVEEHHEAARREVRHSHHHMVKHVEHKDDKAAK